MNKSIIISEKTHEQISARAGLIGLGLKIKQLGILKPIETEVKIGAKDGEIHTLRETHGWLDHHFSRRQRAGRSE